MWGGIGLQEFFIVGFVGLAIKFHTEMLRSKLWGGGEELAQVAVHALCEFVVDHGQSLFPRNSYSYSPFHAVAPGR